MEYTYMSLLLKLKSKKVEKKHIDFINYLMLKYSVDEPLFDKITLWSPYFILEDKDQLEEIIYNMENNNVQPSGD